MRGGCHSVPNILGTNNGAGGNNPPPTDGTKPGRRSRPGSGSLRLISGVPPAVHPIYPLRTSLVRYLGM